MPTFPPEPDLAHLVAHRAQLSLHLLTSLRGALRDVGQTELIPVLDLIARNAGEAFAAASRAIAERRTAKRLRILASLGRLSRLGGSKARPVVHRLAEEITTHSDAFTAFHPGDSRGIGIENQG